MFITYHHNLLEVYIIHKHKHQKNDHYNFLLEFWNCPCNRKFLPLFLKQPPEVVCKKSCYLKFHKLHRKTPPLESGVYTAKFLRTPILKNICKRLLLSVAIGLHNPPNLCQLL